MARRLRQFRTTLARLEHPLSARSVGRLTNRKRIKGLARSQC
jgi:hypothetical protein